MKKYTKPLIKINLFKQENVSTASGSNGLKASIGNTKCEYYGSISAIELNN